MCPHAHGLTSVLIVKLCKDIPRHALLSASLAGPLSGSLLLGGGTGPLAQHALLLLLLRLLGSHHLL